MSLVYFDVKIGGTPAGRIVFRLFDSIVPRTALNFKSLCTGERGIGSTTGKNLSYENTIFHRVIPGFMCQGGDFSKRDGTGGESIYGGKFADESFRVKHTKYGQLSMANAGPNTNGSQFFITFGNAPHLDGKHVVFGETVEGINVLQKIEKVDTGDRDRPAFGQEVLISACGVIGEKLTTDSAQPTGGKRNLEDIAEALNANQTTDKRHKKERKDKKEKKSKKSKKSKKKSGKSSKKSKKRRYSSSSSSSSSSDEDSHNSSSESESERDEKKESVPKAEKHVDERVVAEEDGEIVDDRATSDRDDVNMKEDQEERKSFPVQPARVDADGVVCKGRGAIKYRDGASIRDRRGGNRGGDNRDHRGDRGDRGNNNRFERSRDQGRRDERAPRDRYIPKERSYDRDRSPSRSRSRSRSAGRSRSFRNQRSRHSDGEEKQEDVVQGNDRKSGRSEKVETKELSVAERLLRPLGGSR